MEKPIADDLYKILACPNCKGKLEYTKDMKYLQCMKCKLVYSIKENIPVLLVSEAKKLE